MCEGPWNKRPYKKLHMAFARFSDILSVPFSMKK
jgi:hypothetical protein